MYCSSTRVLFNASDEKKSLLYAKKNLLSKLKKLVSTESSPTMRPTGMPHHVHQIKLLQNMREEMISMNDKFSNQASMLVEAVRKAIENDDVRSGSLNLNALNIRA